MASVRRLCLHCASSGTEGRWNVTLKKVSVGTEADITQAGVADVIPAEACFLGWQESLRSGRARD
jgi:hypothetical protein